MTDSTPTWDLPLPPLGQTPWRDEWVQAMTTIDARLVGMRGSVYAEGNGSSTTFEGVNTPTPVVFDPASVIAGPPCQFCDIDSDTAEITYVGPLDRVPTVLATVDISGSANKTFVVRARRNGEEIPGVITRIRLGPNVTKGNGTIVGLVPMATGDTIRLWVTNESDSSAVTVEDAAVTLRG